MSPSTKTTSDTETKGDELTLTIDDLARLVGMSVRNLREWRTLGLLGPPVMVGRSGRYGNEDVERIRMIQRLHDNGFPLDLIRKLLDGDAELAGDVVRFSEAIRVPLRALDDPGRGPIERAGRVGELLTRMGLTAEEIVEVTAQVNEHITAVAAIFETTWLTHVWEPFVDRGMPSEERPRIESLLTELPERSIDAVVALFTIAIQDQIEAGIERETRRALGSTS